MVTIKDIAKRAGVSMITVSRVLNSSGYVGAETRTRVESAVRELNYVPNQVASSLRSSRSDLLALVLPDITNSFWTTIARGVEDEAWKHGYGVFICNADNDPAKEASYIESLLRRRVGGVLIAPTPDERSEEQLSRMNQHNMKFVVVHRKLRKPIADVVRSDGEGAARMLTTALIESGARRIAYVGLPSWDPASQDRLRGFNDALNAAGLRSDPELIRVGALNPGTGYQLVNDILEKNALPDGILLANTRLAVGGLRALAHAELRFPGDIKVGAFHDTSALDDYAPDLFRVVQPSYGMGQIATKLLLEEITRSGDDFEEIVIPAELHLPGDPTLGLPETVSRDSVRFGH